jgi:NTP pyrophosphatase (non-canonical NTP hydrolase)
MRGGQARSKARSPEPLDADFRAEVADVLSQVLLLAHHHGIDVVEAGDPGGLFATRREISGL